MQNSVECLQLSCCRDFPYKIFLLRFSRWPNLKFHCISALCSTKYNRKSFSQRARERERAKQRKKLNWTRRRRLFSMANGANKQFSTVNFPFLFPFNSSSYILRSVRYPQRSVQDQTQKWWERERNEKLISVLVLFIVIKLVVALSEKRTLHETEKTFHDFDIDFSSPLRLLSRFCKTFSTSMRTAFACSRFSP